MASTDLFLWILFGCMVTVALVVDLLVLNRKAHVISIREAFSWVLIWVSLALVYGVVVFFLRGGKSALEFVTGYLLEESLSVDNIFVFVMIFSHFRIPQKYQPRVLHWGILSAIVLRFIFVSVGVGLIKHFHWMIYVFGAFLIFTAIKMLLHKEEEIHPDKNIIIRLFRLIMPIKSELDNEHFFHRHAGKLHATTLFIVLILIETSDIIFALDSVPAIIAITQDFLIVFTSNIFAILGLRSLYFVLAGAMNLFHYLQAGVSVILGFVGVKMLISDIYHMPIGVALGFIAVVLGLSVWASLRFKPKGRTLV